MNLPVKNVNLFAPVLTESMKALNSLPLPISVTYELLQCTEAIIKQLAVVTKAKDTLVMKYGLPIDGIEGQYQITDAVSFDKELGELGAIEFELPIETKLKISLKHPSLRNAQLSVRDMELVSFYVAFTKD